MYLVVNIPTYSIKANKKIDIFNGVNKANVSQPLTTLSLCFQETTNQRKNADKLFNAIYLENNC